VLDRTKVIAHRDTARHEAAATASVVLQASRPTPRKIAQRETNSLVDPFETANMNLTAPAVSSPDPRVAGPPAIVSPSPKCTALRPAEDPACWLFAAVILDNA
jgi:hypothetical protein